MLDERANAPKKVISMEKVKQIPYGISHFNEVIDQNRYYVDKTMFLPQLELVANFLFLIRPRRFGKSIFLSMLHSYYDISQKDRFQERFSNLWIGQHPTELQGKFQVLYFDFSKANQGSLSLEENFNTYCCSRLNDFMGAYADYYEAEFRADFIKKQNAGDKLNTLEWIARRLGYRLYLIIDEYDNFTNVVLSEQGNQMYHNLTHASGFYREYFKVFKGMFDRIFMMGVSPVTLDDLTSGYNIDWNISTDPRFNTMLGFSETDVRQMFTYYKEAGQLKGDIDAMIEEMRPWYDNYCFARRSLDVDPKIFNCDMVLYYLNNYLGFGHAPDEMVDKNIRTDYSKLKMLVRLDKKNEGRLSTIREIAATDEILVDLRTSFPAERITEPELFKSLLYYYGMLTITGTRGQRLIMRIPNNCVREQYYGYLLQNYQDHHRVDLSHLTDLIDAMVFDGDWQPLFSAIGTAYNENSSVRDMMQGERSAQSFVKAYLSLADYYLVSPEVEMSHGYCDLFLLPHLSKYPDIAHSYLVELKYAPTDATEKHINDLKSDARDQLLKYSQDRVVKATCAGTTLHRIILLFKGWELKIKEEVID